MVKRFNLALFPPDGYVFVDSDGVTHRGGDFSALVGKIRAYRMRRGVQVGDPASEIHAQWCEKFPGYCQAGKATPLVKKPFKTFNPGCLTCGGKKKK